MPLSSSGDSPPRADLVYRVGVVGHRPKRLAAANCEQLAAVIGHILDAVVAAVNEFEASPERRHLYSDEPPRLRAISPLAEGSDTIFARAALDRKFDLCCPMPFPRDEYARDFPGDFGTLPAAPCGGTSDLHDLLDRAREETTLTVFELDGRRKEQERNVEGEAYAAAGQVVLNQSDLLIVVWDGVRSEEPGGTYPALQAAFAYDLPIAFVHAADPHAWGLVYSPTDILVGPDAKTYVPRNAGSAEQIRNVVRSAITPPSPPQPSHDSHAQNEPDLRDAYFAEHRPKWNFWFGWKLFRNVMGDSQLRAQPIYIDQFETQIHPEWPVEDEVAPDASAARSGAAHVEWWVNDRLRRHFGWADKLADFYADKYRTGYVLVFTLAAIAVVVAMLPQALDVSKSAARFFTGAEFLILLSIVVLISSSRSRNWHERWLHYRLLAEFIRQIRILIPLGGGRPFPHVPPHLGGYGEPSQTWMFWQMRAIARATGLPNAVVTREYIAGYLKSLTDVVKSQIQFHDTNSRRSGTINHRLHVAAVWLLGVTFFAVIVHFLPENSGGDRESVETVSQSSWLERWLLFASAALPAIGAAVAGIENQGEFVRVTKRSHATALSLRSIETSLEALRVRLDDAQEIVHLSELSSIATKLSQMMIDEVSDWRVVFIDRPQPAGG
jgi:hypothetical protein